MGYYIEGMNIELRNYLLTLVIRPEPILRVTFEIDRWLQFGGGSVGAETPESR